VLDTPQGAGWQLVAQAWAWRADTLLGAGGPFTRQAVWLPTCFGWRLLPADWFGQLQAEAQTSSWM